jgi:DNA-binding SARP family transcriptional activator
MRGLRIYLFGKFEICVGDQVSDPFGAYKARELFCYLLIHRDRPHPREAVAVLLWPDAPMSQSRKYLRKTLWQLQAALDTQLRCFRLQALSVDSEWIQVKPRADIWIDVAAFDQAFTSCHGVPGKDLDLQRAQCLQTAIDLYRADLLENWYQEWCLCERARLLNMYRSMLDKLVGYCEAHQDYDTGLMYADRSLRCDPARERTHRQLMRLHCLAGDRTAAMRQYDSCVEILEKELGVGPTKRTVALHEQIRSDRLDHSLQPQPDVSTLPKETTARLSEILDRLDQLEKLHVAAHP